MFKRLIALVAAASLAILPISSAADTSIGTGNVTKITAGSNITVSGTRSNPTVATTAAPTFSGTVTASNLTFSTANPIIQQTGSGYVTFGRSGGLNSSNPFWNESTMFTPVDVLTNSGVNEFPRTALYLSYGQLADPTDLYFNIENGNAGTIPYGLILKTQNGGRINLNGGATFFGTANIPTTIGTQSEIGSDSSGYLNLLASGNRFLFRTGAGTTFLTADSSTGLTHNGNDIMAATGTATSTTNYASYSQQFTNSFWSAGAAGANTWQLFNDASNNLPIQYNTGNVAKFYSGGTNNGSATSAEFFNGIQVDTQPGGSQYQTFVLNDATGGANPKKGLRVSGGCLQITNSAFNGVPLQLCDGGAETILGLMTATGYFLSGGIAGALGAITTDANSTIYATMQNASGQNNPFTAQFTNSNFGGLNLKNGMGLNLNPLPAPSAPTLSQSAGGTIAATTYYVKVTQSNTIGETLASTESSLAVSANNLLVVTSPVASGNATTWSVYVSTATGTETLQQSGIATGTNWTEPTTGLVAGVSPPSTGTATGVINIGLTNIRPQGTSTINGGLQVNGPVTFADTANNATIYSASNGAAGGIFLRSNNGVTIANAPFSSTYATINSSTATFLAPLNVQSTAASTISGNLNVGSIMFPGSGYGIGITGTTAGSIFVYANGMSNASTATFASNGNFTTTGTVTAPSVTANGNVSIPNGTAASTLLLGNTGTATSGSNFASQTLQFNNSNWNGTTAVTNNWQMYAGASNQFNLGYNGGQSYQFSAGAISFLNTGINQINTNTTGANTSFLINAYNSTAPTGDLLDVQLGGVNKFQVLNSGSITTNGVTANGQFISTNSTGNSEVKVWADVAGQNWIESGNNGFTGNVTMNLAGYNGNQGSTLNLNFATLNFGGATASTCAGFDGSKNVTSSSNCVHSVAVTGPITNSGTALDPNFGCTTCLTTAGGQTVTAADTFSATLFTNAAITDIGDITIKGNGTGSGSAGENLHLQDTTNTTTTPNKYIRANGINGDLEFVNSAYGAVVAYMQDSGNWYAPAFFNTSRREWKHDIHSARGMDALSLLDKLDWVTFKYNADHGDPNQSRLGYIANDAPALLAGPKHDHFDPMAISTADAIAILQIKKRVESLESRNRMGGPVVINGVTNDPRVDALQQQVHLLWISLAALALLVIGQFAYLSRRRNA